MELVDSHCHIDFPDLAQEESAVLDRAREAGVSHLLCVGVNLEHYPQVRAIAARHPHVFASVGVHPNEVGGADPDPDELIRLAGDDRVVAVGETGLDYFRSTGDLEWQRERFRRHVSAARGAAKPLIVHTRDAPEDTVEIMRAEGAAGVGGVMHCFTGDWAMARQCLDLGFHISFSGIVTFKNATTLKDVARRVPLDRLLVETDSPYLAPVPFRGKRNEPAFVREVAAHVAELRDMPLDTLAGATTENFFRLFEGAIRVQQAA